MLWRRGKAYPQDLRERVFAASAAGLRVGVIAERLMVSVSYVSKTLGRQQRTGERTARPQRCHLAAKLATYHDVIRDHVLANPDITLTERQIWLREEHKVSASTALVCTTINKLRLTLKKSPSGRLSRTGLTSPRRERSGEKSSRASIPPS